MTPDLKAQPVARDLLALLVVGTHPSPHDVLGPHPYQGAITVRTLRPMARAVSVTSNATTVPMEHEFEGIWVAVLPQAEVSDYRLEVEYEGSGPMTVDDPYRYLPTVRQLDQHLINEGRHEQLWQVLGAHVHRYESSHGVVMGTSFAVWAPNAKGVRVSGDFNYWDGRAHPMRMLGAIRGLGAVRPRSRQRRDVQVHRLRCRRGLAAEGRPAGPVHAGAAGARLGRVRVGVRVERC